MKGLTQQVITPVYGVMNTDASEKNQPKGTIRFALNSSPESTDGDQGSRTNELGNTSCIDLGDRTLIGSSLLDNEQLVIFSVNDTTSTISLFDSKKCEETILIQDACLGFSTTNLIDCIFRLRKGCERVIYFTDKVNTFKSINIDSLDKYKDTLGNWDCDKMKFIIDVSPPMLTSSEVSNTGGQLTTGAKQFAIRYLDEDLNPSNFMYITKALIIYEDSIQSDWDLISGDESAIVTSKSIILNFSDLDDNFKYIQIAVLHSNGNLGTVTSVELLPEQVYTSTDIALIYTGTEVVEALSLTEVVVDKLDVSVIDTLAQLDNRLFIGGLKSSSIDYAVMQQAANSITTTYITHTHANKGPTAWHDSKSPYYTSEGQTLMGDEIYGVGIQYFMDNK